MVPALTLGDFEDKHGIILCWLVLLVGLKGWLSYLKYNKRFIDCKYFMVRIPLSNYATNFLTALRRHYVEKTESYYFENQLPMTAEMYGRPRMPPGRCAASTVFSSAGPWVGDESWARRVCRSGSRPSVPIASHHSVFRCRAPRPPPATQHGF